MHALDVAELAAYTAELAATAAFARYLHLQDRRYDPDWTWLAVAAGVVVSATPAIVLARLSPACWRRYEARVAAGFVLSAAIIVPWQVWLSAYRWGQERGYRWATDDKAPALERELGGAAPGR